MFQPKLVLGAEGRFWWSEMKKTKQRGQSLIEIIISLVVLGIILIGLAKVVSDALRNMEFSRNKNFSLHLASSKMEKVRKDRDSLNWEKFLERYNLKRGDSYIETEENLDEKGTLNQKEGRFTRKTSYVILDGEKTKVEVTIEVFWIDSGGKHLTNIKSILTNWK